MKSIIRTALFSIVSLTACAAFGAVPSMKVTVSDAGGKVAFKGATNTSGTFATGNLAAGNYVVQFTSSDSALRGLQYMLVVSAGKKKVSADAVAGDKFTSGGVAMKIDVGAGLNITGQITTTANNVRLDPKTKKKMVWIPPMLGSNMPGHWVEEDSAEAKTSKTRGNMSTSELQKRQSQGISLGGN
jgi:hypothetical protein